jgi:hypothetical protein
MGARRWIQDHPRPLEWAYRTTERLFEFLKPFFARLGYDRVERLILPLERASKEAIFDCRMCGQCILRLTGMTCPMTCPKLLRNGPCGGVGPGGYCEVYPERRCIWTDAYERSLKMPSYGPHILDLQPAVDWRLEGSSAWVNMLTGTDHEQGQIDKADSVPNGEDRASAP